MYEYNGTITNVVDGDTLDILVDLGLRIQTLQRVRLYGINTPERGQPGYNEATVRLVALVLNKAAIAHTIKPSDKYGRWLASLIVDGSDPVATMITEGLGVPYFGGRR